MEEEASRQYRDRMGAKPSCNPDRSVRFCEMMTGSFGGPSLKDAAARLQEEVGGRQPEPSACGKADDNFVREPRGGERGPQRDLMSPATGDGGEHETMRQIAKGQVPSPAPELRQ